MNAARSYSVPPYPPPRARILVVDALEVSRKTTANWLSLDYEVAVASDAQSALDELARGLPDLILAEDLPRSSATGESGLAALRTSQSTRRIPLILMVERAAMEQASSNEEWPIDDYLIKPFTARELLARVGSQLELARVRRDAAARVDESEARFRHVADHSPLMFWVMEADGGWVYFNQRWYEFTGRTRETSLGTNWIEAVHPEDRPAIEEHLQRVVTERTGFQLEYRLLRYDGTYRWVFDTGSPRQLDGRHTGFVGSILDITDQREELAEIERSRSQMQLALEAGRTGVFEWDLPTGRVSWSAELERLYGVAPGGFEGSYRAWAQRVVPEDVAKVEALIQHCFEGQIKEAAYEFRALLPDGTERWMEGKARFNYTANGTPRQMIGINLDIDERKRAQIKAQFLDAFNQELAAQSEPEEILRTIIRALGTQLKAHRCYFFTLDETKTRATVGSNWRRDPKSQDMAGDHTFTDFADMELARETLHRVIRIEDVRVYPATAERTRVYTAVEIASWMTVPFVRENRGNTTICVTDDRPRRWRDDEVDLVETVLTRVWPMIENARTEQVMRKAEAQIRESEERLRTAIAASRMGTWELDLKTNQVHWDARCQELFGRAQSVVDHAKILAAIHPEDRDRIQKAVTKAISSASRQPYDEEYRVVDPRDGAIRWVRAAGRAAFDENRVERFTGTMIETTELALARQILAQRGNELEQLVAERTAELQETVAELEGFSYSISHDLRAPLRAMQSFAQILSEEFSAMLPGEAQDYLRRIVSSADRMDRLIHDVLLYSRVGRTGLQLSPIDLETLLYGILDTYPQLHSSAVDIVLEKPLPRVQANAAALTQCLSNLLGNAVKFVGGACGPRFTFGRKPARTECGSSSEIMGLGSPKKIMKKSLAFLSD